MSELTLVTGNCNYSSWSLRPWILLKHLGLPFREIRIALDTPEFADTIARYSPTRRVPVLLDGALAVWESVAILEYLNELGAGGAWPEERTARATARAVTAEMHAGFGALRGSYPMNIRARNRRVPMTPALAGDIARIDRLWNDCRQRFGADGPWLFGRYSAADSMYLPVVLRFETYGSAGLSQVARDYAATVVADPLLAPWVSRAVAETERIEHDEVGE
jgi:glutathione S-transferase